MLMEESKLTPYGRSEVMGTPDLIIVLINYWTSLVGMTLSEM